MLVGITWISLASELSAQHGDELRLIQEATLRVPRGFEVSGGAIASNGAVIFWSREARGVRISDKAGIRAVCSSLVSDPLAAAYVDDGLTAQIVDAATGVIFQVTQDGTCSRIARMGSGLAAAAYSRQKRTWIGIRADGERSVLVLPGRTRSAQVALPEIPAADLPNTHLTASARGILLSALRGRKEWLLVSPQGRAVARGEPGSAEAQFLAAQSVRELIGMPTHALEEGFLQMLIDPRSEMRVMVVYNLAGRVVRLTRLDVS